MELADLDSEVVSKVELCVENVQGVEPEDGKAEMADHWLAESSSEPKVAGFREQVAWAGTGMELGFELGVLGLWKVDVRG